MPGEDHPRYPVGAVAVVDDPAGRPEHEDGEEDQCGECGHAEPGENGNGQHEVARPRAIPFMLVSGSSVPRFLR